MNPWIEHVKKVRAQKKNAKKSYKEVLQIAKGTYKRKATKATKGVPAKRPLAKKQKTKMECKVQVESKP